MGERMTLGTLIRARREAAGLSLRALAARLGVSAPFLHDVEHDRRRLTVDRWADIGAAIGVTTRELAEAAIAAGHVKVDARRLSKAGQRAVADALVEEADARK